MKAFLKHFVTGRGWAHFLFGLAIVYLFMYYGSVPGSGFWYNMAHSYTEAYTWHWSAAVGLNLGAFVVAFCIGFFIEELQAIFFRAERSVFDERWTGIGAPGAAILYAVVKANASVAWACLIALAVVTVYVIYFICKHWSAFKTKLIGKKK